MLCGNIIPSEIVKEITGAKSDDKAALQAKAVIELIEEFLGVLLIKRDIKDEKITLPYNFTRVIRPKFAPINSVSSLEVITHNGTYKAETKHLAIGAYTIELLSRFWACFPYAVLPKAVAAVKLSYNAGYFNKWQELPALIQEAAEELLAFKFASDFKAGFQSEHLGDYSYTKGKLVRGLPEEIASMLEAVEL